MACRSSGRESVGTAATPALRLPQAPTTSRPDIPLGTSKHTAMTTSPIAAHKRMLSPSRSVTSRWAWRPRPEPAARGLCNWIANMPRMREHRRQMAGARRAAARIAELARRSVAGRQQPMILASLLATGLALT